MMKNMRKIFSILLVMMVVLSLSLTAFAAEGEGTYTITITDSVAGRTYEAYQILTGTPQTVDGKKVLINQAWGKNAVKFGQEITAADEAALEAGIASNASTYVKFTDPAGTTSTQVDNNGVKQYEIKGLEPGYYLVRQTAADANDGHDAYTAYILQIVEDVTVETKSAKPTVDKQVEDENDDAENPADVWGDTADHAINESFQFKLTATVTADKDYTYYETYKLVFTDTMSAGITFEEIVSVKVGSTTLEPSQYTCTATANQPGGSWTLTIADLTKIEGVDLTTADTIVEVIYKAHLNENALADAPADNGVVLKYSNNPNAGGEGDMGTTPEDKVYVFTYEVKNTKTDGEEALAGAGFRLYTDKDCTVEYKLMPIYDEEDEEKVIGYRPAVGTEAGVEMVSPADGKFNIVGLDCGTYYLKETTVPEGYNPAPVVEIVISATHEIGEDGNPTVVFDENSEETMNNEIVNKAGLTLPSTGGIGTTFMYIIGGILVFFAVVILVTKLKMKVN